MGNNGTNWWTVQRDSGNLFTTNTIPISRYACGNFSSNAVYQVHAGTATNTIPYYSYTKYNSGFGYNGAGVFTNLFAGDIETTFGAFMSDGNTGNVTLQLWTNGVRCGAVELNATMSATTTTETGFKTTIISLPANATIELKIGNTAANATSVNNVCFKLNGLN